MEFLGGFIIVTFLISMPLLLLLDPYRGQGTTYLHIPDDRGHDVERGENPTGAVVVPISLATTFQQAIPGQATAPDDPNSFGMGYEYSRTGKYLLPMGMSFVVFLDLH
jgi:hypothetical protein